MITVYGKEVPTELHELVTPDGTALVVIDMQNDWCSEGGSGHQASSDLRMYKEIIPRIAAFSRLCRRIGIPVVNIGMSTLPEGKSDSPAWIRLRMRANKNFNPANEGAWNFTMEGTWGAEFVPDLAPQPGDFVVKKFRSTAVLDTNLNLILRSNSIRNVLVTGCSTEGCVASTVGDLCFYDYFPVVLSDCVGSDVRELHEAAMFVMSAYRADVTTSTEVAKIWNSLSLTTRTSGRRR